MHSVQARPFLVLFTVWIALAACLAACQSHSNPSTAATPQPSPASQSSSGTLKIVSNPEGGQFAYGSLTGKGTLPQAMTYMLRQVHTYFGDKPQVGNFLQSHDGNSLATFFTLTAKGQPMAGLVIVSMQSGKPPEVAVLFDTASRFPTTEPSLMRALSAAQQSGGGTAGGTGSHAQAQPVSTAASQPERLTMATGGDRSASIGMPAGWRITGVAGGQLTAEGPRGETVGLGLLYQGIVDPRSPQSQMQARYRNGGLPPLVCPLTSDLFPAFVSVSNQVRKNLRQSQGTYKLISSTALEPDGGPVRPMQFIFTVDFNDGIGPRKGSVRVGAMHVNGAPTWAMTVSTSSTPVKYADAENATLLAVIRSYSQNAAVIGQESAADMSRIRAVGQMVSQNAAAADARRKASSQAYEQHNADLDWQSAINENYILDRSVVGIAGTGAHATVSNNLADALVKSNPNQLEYVPNQQLIQGTDY